MNVKLALEQKNKKAAMQSGVKPCRFAAIDLPTEYKRKLAYLPPVQLVESLFLQYTFDDLLERQVISAQRQGTAILQLLPSLGNECLQLGQEAAQKQELSRRQDCIITLKCLFPLG